MRYINLISIKKHSCSYRHLVKQLLRVRFKLFLLGFTNIYSIDEEEKQICYSIFNLLSYRSSYTALLQVFPRSKFCYCRLSKTHASNCSIWVFFTFSLSVLLIYLQAVIRFLRSGHLMCTYKALVPKHQKLYSFLNIKPMVCCYRCYQ